MKTVRMVLLLISISTIALSADMAVQSDESSSLPEYDALRVSGQISVDGILDEPDWVAAAGIELQFPWQDLPGPKQKTVAKLLWDDDNIYVSYNCQDTDMTAVLDTRDDPTYKDDCVEIFISPNPRKIDLYYGLEMNCRAVLYDYFCVEKRTILRNFDLRGVKLATDMRGTLNNSSDKDNGWSLEVAIPFENFDDLVRGLPPEAGTTWRINLNRLDGTEPNRQFSMWSSSQQEKPSFHHPNRFGILVFSEKKVR